MTNRFFAEEEITDNDLYFLCYMIERLARKLHQPNCYILNKIAKDEWVRLISLANVLHCENALKIEDEWIDEYHLEKGDFDITAVDPELVDEIPTATQMGKVYMRLIHYGQRRIMWKECFGYITMKFAKRLIIIIVVHIMSRLM